METWFSNLRDYFPAKEMKSETHMTQLFKEKPASYKLDEGPHYTLVYFEKPDFLFIDYILVNSSSRGNGLGSKVIERVKKKNKMIILEVDPISQEDPETAKRVRFYQKQNFKKVSSIEYVRKHPITGERSEMDIFYWSPQPESDEWVMEKMKEAYEEVHAFNSEEFYGNPPQATDEVLKLRVARRSTKAE